MRLVHGDKTTCVAVKHQMIVISEDDDNGDDGDDYVEPVEDYYVEPVKSDVHLVEVDRCLYGGKIWWFC